MNNVNSKGNGQIKATESDSKPAVQPAVQPKLRIRTSISAGGFSIHKPWWLG